MAQVKSIKNLILATINYLNAGNAMATPGKLTFRELDHFELYGNNIERLAYKIGFGL